jgi:RNA polymerase sigma factor (TIGR02999 family)
MEVCGRELAGVLAQRRGGQQLRVPSATDHGRTAAFGPCVVPGHGKTIGILPREAVWWTAVSEVTRILSAIERGEDQAAEKLLPLVYDELRRLAAQRMVREQPEHTLQATALVHEAYLRLVDVERVQRWNSRGHFFAAAAEAMRRILVENARRKRALRRGGGQRKLDFEQIEPAAPRLSDDVLALNDALERLEQKDRVKADLVKLRYFAGLTMDRAAESLGISLATAHRYWNYARAWLHQEIERKSPTSRET